MLTFRQRLILFHHCELLFADVAVWDDDSINFDCFVKHGVRAVHLLTAEVHVNELLRRGVDTIPKLRQLGFDALHLTDASFCSSCVETYGVDETRNGFLGDALDAVAMAGSPAVSLLDLDTRMLLERTVGFPQCASAVLQQQVELLGTTVALRGLDTQLLLDSGLRSNSFFRCGVTASCIKEVCGCSIGDLERLGY